MNTRLVVAAILASTIGGGLVGPAFADSTPEPRREKLCVRQATVLPEGYCVTWIAPLGQDR